MEFHSVFQLIVVATVVQNTHCQMGKTTITGDKSSGTLSFGTPDLSDEESQADYMPSGSRCDGCRAVVWAISDILQKNIDKKKPVREGKKELGEDLLIELFEDEICDREADTWQRCGLKVVDDVKRIQYPGSESENVPGIMQGGGRWPPRLSAMCFSYVEA